VTASAAPSEDRLVAALAAHGRDAVAFQALEPGIDVWTDARTGAVVPYADTGRAWVGAGLPLAAPDEVPAVARRFADAARAHGRRCCWFAAESRVDGFPALLVGEQPEWVPADWPSSVRASRRLREQLRRSRAAGVTVRAASAAELGAGQPLRRAVDAVGRRWLAGQHMEPMGFLVTLAPWQRPEDHRYFVAFRGPEVVAFLSLVPIPARRGWLFEDLLRSAAAPNGTSEALIDLAMRSIAAEGAAVATLGLAPLSGPVAGWLRVARVMARGLYDFRGLRAFKARLRPHRWRPVWLVAPPGARPHRCLQDALRAFVGTHLAGFLFRTILRHPSAACVALALPLVPWTLALGLLVAAGAHGPLGYSRGALAAWTCFDSALDASVHRMAHVGLGVQATTIALRAAAVGAPVLGSILLWWSARNSAPADLPSPVPRPQHLNR